MKVIVIVVITGDNFPSTDQYFSLSLSLSSPSPSSLLILLSSLTKSRHVILLLRLEIFGSAETFKEDDR